MVTQQSILQTKYLRWLRRFITPKEMPDTIIEQQQAMQLMFFLFMAFTATGFNLLMAILIAGVTSFTWLGFIASTILYISSYKLHYKSTAVITTLTALTLPFILFIVTPDDLTIVTIMFLLVIALFVSSQFLSLQANLQVSILLTISVFFLNTVTSSASSLSFASIFVPVMIIIFLGLLNAFGRRQLMLIVQRNESPQSSEFFTNSIELIPMAVIIQVDKSIVVVNRTATRLIGIENEALVGRTVTDFISISSSKNYTIDHEAENLTIHYDDELIQEGIASTCKVTVTARSIKYAGKLATLMILYPKDLSKDSHINTQSISVPDENSDAQDRMQTRAVQQGVVAELGLLAFNSNDQYQLMQEIIVLCEQVITPGFVAIFEHNSKNKQLLCVNLSEKATAFQVGEVIEDDYLQSLLAYTLHTGDFVISEDLADETRFKALPVISQTQHASAIGVVIMGNNNIPYGVLAVYSQSTHHFPPDEIYFLQSIANVSANFIERNRAQTAEREQAEFTRALGEATAAINLRLELPEVLGKIITYLQDVVPQTEQASIMLRDEDTELYYHYITWGFAEDTPEASSRYAFSSEDFPLLKDMILTLQPVNIADTSRDTRWIMRDTVSKTRSYMGTPIILDGDVIGFISLHAFTESAFSERDMSRLKTFAETASTAIGNAQKQEGLEQKVQQRTVELNQQSEQLSTILSASGDGIFYAENFQIAFVNEALCTMTGYSLQELIGQPTTIFRPDDAVPNTHKLQSALVTANFGEPWRDTIRLRRKDGTVFEAGLTITRVESSNEDIIRAVTIVRDISKERELEELKKTFIAAAAHDLRSPISSLKMRMHMIKHQPEKIDYHMERLDYIIERMNRLVNDLLDAHGRIVLRPQNIILQEMLDLVVDILSTESEEKGVQFEYESLPDPIIILADKHRLEQVFYNLITNAINYTDSGGTITVAYEVDTGTQTVIVDIRDTGLGIPDDEQENIFLPFYRAKENDRKGNGLGLSITREIVNLHKGDIQIYSKVGKGSIFSVTLPLLSVE